MAVEKEVITGGKTILRFEDLSFWYNENKPIYKESSYGLKEGLKVTLMGPNGAGKSTLFKIIMNEYKPNEGQVFIDKNIKVAIAEQTIPHTLWEKTVREFLEMVFKEKVYDIDRRAKEVFQTMAITVPAEEFLNKKIRELSGGQKGRLLIARALIQKPDLLLLDEPTNNLDKAGIKLLTDFMKTFPGTAIVISHDENFLNAFSHGILYVNTHTQKLEQYVGNYFKALEEIKRKIEADERANAQLEKEIQENKDKVNFFAHKGGKMRKLAAKLKDEIDDMEDSKVDVRKEDKTIKKFKIPCQPELGGNLIEIKNIDLLWEGEIISCPVDIKLKKGDKLEFTGPNGIGKTTLLNKIATVAKTGGDENIKIGKTTENEKIKIGYYRQDFSTLDFSKKSFDELAAIFQRLDEHHLRSVASSFLISGKELATEIGALSEGQKALLMWAYLTLSEPGVLIIDEPTNHVNFRHIPLIAEAIKNYEGAVIIISHVGHFIRETGVKETINLEKLIEKNKKK